MTETENPWLAAAQARADAVRDRADAWRVAKFLRKALGGVAPRSPEEHSIRRVAERLEREAGSGEIGRN